MGPSVLVALESNLSLIASTDLGQVTPCQDSWANPAHGGHPSGWPFRCRSLASTCLC